MLFRTQREEQRQFIREMTLRVEKGLGGMERRLDANTRRIEEGTRMLAQQRREFVEESRAGRQALLAVLDRLEKIDPRGGAARGA